MAEKSRLKLVYDVSVFKNGVHNSSARSGIFFTAINILRELIKREDVEIALYADSSVFYYVKHVLDREFPNNEFKLIASDKFIFRSKLKVLKILAAKNKKYLEKMLLQIGIVVSFAIFRFLRSFLRPLTFSEYDIFLSPFCLVPEKVKAQRYTILYDLIPLNFPMYHSEPWQQGFWLYDLCQTLNSRDKYFVISDYSRNDFLENFPQIDPNNITKILLARNEKFKHNLKNIGAVRAKYNIPEGKKYVFSLCSLEPRKNLQRAVTTFIEFIKKHDIDDMVFVLGGGHWDIFIEQIKETIENLGEYKAKIVRAGYIDDEDLPVLYSGAEWFVYTSACEGFGLPPLEAMSCGCPVITSNNSSLPEVVGDAGIMIDYDSDEQHISAYEKYYFDSELRKINAQKGFERSKLFSWKKCVDTMVEVMKRS